MDNTIELWLEDCTGGKYFHRTAGLGYHQGELNNLKMYMASAMKYPERYSFIRDIKSLEVKTSEDPVHEFDDLTDDELLGLLEG